MSHLHPGATNVTSLFRPIPGDERSPIEQAGAIISGILLSEIDLDTATRVDQEKEPNMEYTGDWMQPRANFFVEYRPEQPKCAYIILTKSGEPYGRFSLCENEDKIVRHNDLKYEPPSDPDTEDLVYDWDEQGMGVGTPPNRPGSPQSGEMGGRRRRRRRTRRRRNSKSTFASRKRTL